MCVCVCVFFFLLLPRAFYQVKLKVAHSDNLASLPASIGSLSKLQHLAASHCKLTEVPEGLGQCTALKTLDLSFNKLAGAL